VVLGGCKQLPTQAIYEEIRMQEKNRSVGKPSTPAPAWPSFKGYEKERARLKGPETTDPPTKP
jgi:hypothetical protein